MHLSLWFLAITDWISPEWSSGALGVDWIMVAKVCLQLIILFGIVVVLYTRLIRNSHADRLIKGLFVILLIFLGLWGISRIAGFTMLEVLFGASIQLLIIGLIVIFQPELRRLLFYLGQAEWFGLGFLETFGKTQEDKMRTDIAHITEAIRYLSKSKTGGLIVLESPNDIGGHYLEVGTALDAKLSTELLLTIFHRSTPLHDGAVVIDTHFNVLSAGVLLPLTEDPNLSWRYGTRHRAAIGLTEISKATCIVVSEETGHISLAKGGQIHKVEDVDELRAFLEAQYGVEEDDPAPSEPTSVLSKIPGLAAKFNRSRVSPPPLSAEEAAVGVGLDEPEHNPIGEVLKRFKKSGH